MRRHVALARAPVELRAGGVAASSEAKDLGAERLLGVAEREEVTVRSGRSAAAESRAAAESAGGGEGGVALELPKAVRVAEAVEVGDVPVVEVGVALARGGLGGLTAVALVAELDGAQAGGACKEGAVDAVEDGVVALGVAGVVDVGVAEVVVLGDVAAEGGAEVEGRLEDADVQAKAALTAGAEAGGGDGGAADGGVGEAGEEGA